MKQVIPGTLLCLLAVGCSSTTTTQVNVLSEAGGSAGQNAVTGGSPVVATGGTPAATGGTPIVATGGTFAGTGGTPVVATGGTPAATGGTPKVATGGTQAGTGGALAGTGGSANIGTTVTFVSGKAVGAMSGYAWVALGASDSISSPTCGAANAIITAASGCSTTTNWSSTTAVCITGSIPALPASPTSVDYTNNWGISLGINATNPATSGLGRSFTSRTITVTGSPLTGLRATVHRLGDSDAVSYCAALTSGVPITFTSFVTDCYNATPTGTKLTATDVPNIDNITVEVPSSSSLITVTNLCITGIVFG